MKKVEDILYKIELGWELRIVGSTFLDKSYYWGYIARREGDILVDVEQVGIIEFLSHLPNLLDEISGNNYYRLSYDYECSLYHSAIVHFITIDSGKEVSVIDDYKYSDASTFQSCINELEKKIETFKIKNKRKFKIFGGKNEK